MNITFAGSGWSFEYACEALAKGYNRKIMHQICTMVYDFESFQSLKTLVVVRSCPCCHNPGLWNYIGEKFIMISPLCGIDKAGFKISTPNFYPPFRNPGKDKECATAEEFLKAWQQTIETAIKEAEASGY